MRLLLHPIGPGESRELVNPDDIIIENARWLPDGQRIVFFGPTARARSRGYVQQVSGGAPVAFTPDGVEPPTWWALAVSPDGTRVTGRGPDGAIALWPVGGGPAQPMPKLPADAVPIAWSPDGRSLVIARRTTPGWALSRFEIETGQVLAIREVTPREVAGLRATFVASTPDARYFVHSYSRLLVDLYVADGLK